jgi:hypothetical protein
MVTLGLNHIGHAAAAVSTVLNLPERGRAAAPTLLTLAGFTPMQVELLVTGFVVTVASASALATRLKGHFPLSGTDSPTGTDRVFKGSDR